MIAKETRCDINNARSLRLFCLSTWYVVVATLMAATTTRKNILAAALSVPRRSDNKPIRRVGILFTNWNQQYSSTRSALVAESVYKYEPDQRQQLEAPYGKTSHLFSDAALQKGGRTIWKKTRRRGSTILEGRPQKLPLARFLSVPVLLTGILSSFPTKALATTITASNVKSAMKQKGLLSIRGSLRILLVTYAAIFVIRMIRLRVRQTIDATSEWSRYANHPATRARALASLLIFQLFPLWSVTRLLQLCGRDTLAKKMRDRTGKVFAGGLLRLGPLYIKMGQILSSREKLFPEEWAESMEQLQDRVPAKTGDAALQLAYDSVGGKEEFDKLFADFDPEPLAAASLGQVHKAVLADDLRPNRANDETGGVVAVKVQRAKLRQIYDQDLVVMNKIAAMMDKIGNSNTTSSSRANVGGISQSWTEIFEDAEEILYREIDYRDEANNARRFADDFGLDIGGNPLTVKSKNDGNATKIAASRDGELLPSAANWLRTPYVYTDLSSEKLLIMEFVPSIKITNKKKLDEANITFEEREYLSDMLARAYLRQFCCNLFFSTDPHAGNLGVEILEDAKSSNVNGASYYNGTGRKRPTFSKRTSKSDPYANTENRRVRLVFYDFGQATTLNENQADGILDIIEAIVDMDVERSVEAFQTMGVLKEDADLNKVRAKVAENYRTGKVKANKKKLKRSGYKSSSKRSNSTSTDYSGNNTNTEAGKDSEVMKYFDLPAEYAFVARALSQMDGVGKSLDPDFDFISSAAPFIVEIKGAKQYLKDEIEKKVKGFFTELTNPFGKDGKVIEKQ